jgi:hypothetical protein
MINKRKILGLIIGLGNLTITDISFYTKLSRKVVEKHVGQLIKENKIEYSKCTS